MSPSPLRINLSVFAAVGYNLAYNFSLFFPSAFAVMPQYLSNVQEVAEADFRWAHLNYQCIMGLFYSSMKVQSKCLDGPA